MKKKLILIILMVLFLIPFKTQATTYTINQLKALYPDGTKFTDTYSYRYTTDENPNTIVNMVETNCAGFAATIYYKFYGLDHHWATQSTDILSIEPGDIVRYQEPSKGANTSEGHSVFVISRSGSTVTVAEANYGEAGVIKWGRQCDISEFNYGFDHIDKGLYTIGSVSVSPTVDIPQNVKTSFNALTGKLNVNWTRVSRASDYIVSVFTEQDVKNNNFSNPIATERPTYNLAVSPTITLTQTGLLYVYVQTVLDEYKSSFSSPIILKRIQISNLTIDNKPTGNIYVGDEFTLKAIKEPSDANYQTKLTWTSSNESVATVTSGCKVNVIGEGTTTIMVESENGIKTGYSFTAMDNTPVESITLNKTSKELLKDEEFQLTATILPEKLANKVVNWNSSDSSIATVDSTGKVKAIAKGTAIITASVEDKSATCTIIVSNTEIKEIDFSLPFAIEGESYYMRAYVTPNDANADGLIWTSSNPQVLKVSSYDGSDAWLEGMHSGTATITIQASNGVRTDAEIKVYAKIKSLGITGPTDKVYVGDEFELNYNITADGEYYDYMALTSTNPDVIEVDGSKLIAKQAGSSMIKATDFTGKKTASTTIEVYDRKPITDITLYAPQKELTVGQSVKYHATVVPEDTTDSKELTWKSSDESVATIDSNGTINALSAGTTTISVTSSNNIKKTFEVMVNNSNIAVTNITLNKTSLSLKEGESETLTPTITPANATDKTVTWTSSNTAVATVSNGTVIAKKAGTATITAQAGTKSTTCQITVTANEIPVTNITLNKTSLSLKEGESETLTPTITPANATDKTVTWTSSNTAVATVSNGTVIAKKAGTATITAQAGTKSATCQVTITAKENKKLSVAYMTHVQDYGDQKYVRDGQMAGTSGQSKRLEAIRIKLENQPVDGDIEYRTHVEDYGWMSYVKNGAMSGTSHEAKRLEAIQIRLTGPIAEQYDVYYRVHAQDVGWMNWAKNDEMSGTAGYGRRLEGIEIVIVEKGQNPPTRTNTKTTKAFIQKQVLYTTHVEDYGWQSEVADGAMSGTSHQSKRLEGIKIRLYKPQYTGDIEYRTHVQDIGWQAPVKNGQMSGTSGQAKRLEAIEIQLTEEMAQHYDIYYRVHAEHFGWMNWAKNGQSAGTAHYGYRLEGIEIVIVDKGEAPPTRTDIKNSQPFVDKREQNILK